MRPDSSFLERPIGIIGDLLRERIYPLLAAGASLFLLLWYLNKHMLTPEEKKAVQAFVFLVALGLMVVSLRLLRGKRLPELQLLLQNTCWIILSRILLGKLNYQFDSETYWAILFFCLFNVGIVLKKRQRDVFLTVLTAIVCTILLTWAIVAILTVLKGRSLNFLPMLSGSIRLRLEEKRGILYVQFSEIHRNMTAIYFLVPICLMLYQCVRNRQPGWYVAAGVTIPAWYAIIALQHSRSAYLSVAIVLALLIGRLILRKSQMRSFAAKIMMATSVVIVLTGILYQGFFVCSNLISRYSHEPQSSLIYSKSSTATSESNDGESDPIEMNNPGISVYDSRSTLDDAHTLTGRTRIWKAIVPLLKSKKQVVLGSQVSNMMTPINKQIRWKSPHMHNTLLQQLLMAGIPGFLLYLMLLLSLAVRIVKCYFRKNGNGREETLVLGIALTGIMCYGVLEPILCMKKPVISLLFCLIAGCFLGELSDDNAFSAARGQK